MVLLSYCLHEFANFTLYDEILDRPRESAVTSIASKWAAVAVVAVALIITGNAYAGSHGGGSGGSSAHQTTSETLHGPGSSHNPIVHRTNPFRHPRYPTTKGHPCVPKPGMRPCNP
jgi:hypothetical protein